MAILHVQFMSEVLQLQTRLNVILPDSFMLGGPAAARLPVLYLLHGLSDDSSIWLRRTSIERYVQRYRLAVVMPETGRGFYTDMRQGPRYWTFISEEVSRLAETVLPVVADRSSRFVAGLSMGGYGALKLALRQPEKYAAAASMSGAVDIRYAGKLDDPGFIAEARRIFGSAEEIQSGGDELFTLASQADVPGLPDLYLCCGTDDFLYADNLRFCDHLKDLGIPHQFHVKKGAVHSWDYWDEAIQDILRWLPIP